ncbi:response regulator [Sphingomonas sp. KR3-1]|uniref:response regulator n=1 Tax=Sphingomonas sp. KR3-1 TaxID=3156611 RepID=UPI0032B53E99
MLNGLPILIVEDEPLIAMNLASAVAELDGKIVGPVDTVAAAFELLASETIAAAILDANLLDRDVTPLATSLAERSVPFVIFTGTGLPPALAATHPDLPVIIKPARSTAVLAALLQRVSPDRLALEARCSDPGAGV